MTSALRLIVGVCLVLSFSIFGCAQCMAPGCLDTTFGTSGTGEVVTVVGTNSLGKGVAVESLTNPDGSVTNKVVVAAEIHVASGPVLGAARYNLDGTVDPSFGNAGVAVTNVAGYTQGLAIQSDGKIVVVGLGGVIVIRLTTSGALDSTFGNGGVVSISSKHNNPAAFAVAIQTDGKIVVTGDAMTVWRFNSNGSLDTSFGSSGSTQISFGRNIGSRALAMALQNVPVGTGSEQRIVLGGFVSPGSIGADDFAMVRLTASGQLDKSFGSGGLVRKDFFGSTDTIHALAIDGQNGIVAAGQVVKNATYFFAVAHFGSNGALDTAFGSGGSVLTPVGSGNSYLNSAVIAPDGRIVVTGFASSPSSGNDVMALARFSSVGVLDVTFGMNGTVTDDFSASGFAGGTGSGVAIAPDGKLLVAGEAERAGGSSFEIGLARFYY